MPESLETRPACQSPTFECRSIADVTFLKWYWHTEKSPSSLFRRRPALLSIRIGPRQLLTFAGSKGVFGSLTFGGYDSSRFVSNDLSLNLAPDITRDLVVGLYAITSTTVNHSNTSLLPSPILAFIDSTQPNFYLPIKSCQAFESAFRLVYNQTAEKYLVDDALHRTLLSMNPNITFTIGNLAIGGPSVDIVLPYASFDLQVIYPLVPSPTRYFPLKRAANDSQYTLGRTFMQEA